MTVPGNQRPRVIGAGPFDPADFVRELREAIDDGCGGEPLSAVEVQHVGSPHPMKTWTVREGVDVDELASQIIGRTQRDADAWKGEPQTYQFRFFYGVGAQQPMQVYSGSFCGVGVSSGAAGRSYPANGEGVTGLSISMAGESHRTLLDGYATAIRSLEQQLRDARGEIATLTKERADVWKLYADLLTVDREAKAAAAQAERDDKLWQDALGMLKALAPSAINRLTGTQLLPEVNTPELLQFKGLFDTLAPDQIEKITGVLTPQQGIALADLFNVFLDGRDRQKALADVVARVEVARKTGLTAGHNAPQLAAKPGV